MRQASFRISHPYLFNPPEFEPAFPGFFPVDAATTPEPVRRAALSVVKIKPLVERQAFPLAELQKLWDVMTPEERDCVGPFLEACEQEGLESCEILIPFSGRGSGLIAGDGSTVFTALHVLFPELTTFKRPPRIPLQDLVDKLTTQAQERGVANVVVWNDAGERIAHPLVNPLRIQEIDPAYIHKLATTVRTDNYTDYVELRSGQVLGTPLPIAQEQSGVGEPLFHLGWAGCTGCEMKAINLGEHEIAWEHRIAGQRRMNGTYSRFPQPDADGKTMRYTTGTALDPLKTDNADIYGGMSGGPVVNAQGEVVGLSSAFEFSIQRRFVSFARSRRWVTKAPAPDGQWGGLAKGASISRSVGSSLVPIRPVFLR